MFTNFFDLSLNSNITTNDLFPENLQSGLYLTIKLIRKYLKV